MLNLALDKRSLSETYTEILFLTYQTDKKPFFLTGRSAIFKTLSKRVLSYIAGGNAEEYKPTEGNLATSRMF